MPITTFKGGVAHWTSTSFLPPEEPANTARPVTDGAGFLSYQNWSSCPCRNGANWFRLGAVFKRLDKNGLKARLVWQDANEAYTEVVSAASQGDRDLFRRRWVAAITLLRAVGHVLNGADKKLHPVLSPAITAFLDTTKNEPIFKDFINRARNLTVKEYRSSLYGRWDTSSPMSRQPVRSGEQVDSELVFQDGDSEDRNINDLFGEAMRWWDNVLNEFEQQLRETQAGQE